MNRTRNVVFLILLSLPAAAQVVSVEEVVDLAIEKNYDIRIQRAVAASAENDNSYAFGAFLPTLNAQGSYTKSISNSNNLAFPNSTNPTPTEQPHRGIRITNPNASAQVGWILFDGTKMFATRQRISQLAEVGEVNVRNQIMNSVATVVAGYYNIVRQKQQLKALHELLLVNEERVKLAEKKLQVGTGGKPELLQAKVDYNTNRLLELQQETLIQQLKDQLNGLVGMGLPDVYEISDTIPINLNLTIAEIETDIENTNQALVAARKNVKVAELVLWENKAARSPVISFTSSYNYNRQSWAAPISPATQQFTRTNGLSYGLVATIPILNNLNVNRLINQARINVDRVKLVYDQQRAIAVVGVRNAFVSYENAKKALIIGEENILVAKENVFIAFESFKKGVATYIELRTAQQTLADSYNQLILARYNAKAAETELLRLKGALLK